jgi:hypothetical protein
MRTAGLGTFRTVLLYVSDLRPAADDIDTAREELAVATTCRYALLTSGTMIHITR